MSKHCNTPHIQYTTRHRHHPLAPVDSLRLRPDAHYRAPEDILLLRAEAEAAGHGMLHWWYPTRFLEVAVLRDDY
jgi:hypothetical protein